MTSLKEEHERFMSGHNGTTTMEVAVMTITPCASLLLRDVLILMHGLHALPFWPRVVFDFSLIMVPAILMSTVLSNVTTLISVIVFAAAAVYYAYALRHVHMNGINLAQSVGKVLSLEMEAERPFLNYTRALMNLSTAINILGVDFTVFPRRFAKTETFGTGGMDIGVGCFVVSNALVCPEARGKIAHCHSLKGLLKRIAASLRSSVPLLVFGVGRLLAVKGTNYHEHASEYGVHWNFFFTLALVKFLSTVVLSVCAVRWSAVTGLLLMSAYQVALSTSELTTYVLHGADGKGGRHGILDSNREGLISCLGYVAIYLIGVQIGSHLFSKKKQTFGDWVVKMGLLIAISVTAYIGQFLSSIIVQPTSRRMANMAFVFWNIGVSVQTLGGCLLVDLLSTAITALALTSRKKSDDVIKSEGLLLSSFKGKDSTPGLLHAVNLNGLFFFLLSNILTGLVNMSIPTIHTPAATAVVILLAYTFLLSAVIVFMDKHNIRTRFW